VSLIWEAVRYDVTFCRVCITTIAIEKQQYVPFTLLLTYMSSVKNIKLSTVATETWEGVPFALLSSYKLSRAAVDNVNGTYIFI